MLFITNKSLSPCAYTPYTMLDWILSSCSGTARRIWRMQLYSPEFLKSTQEKYRCFLVFVMALAIAPWSMLRNTKFVCPWDGKGPSSAEKWYGRTLGHLLAQLCNALACCRMLYGFNRGFICQLCCLVGKYTVNGLERG